MTKHITGIRIDNDGVLSTVSIDDTNTHTHLLGMYRHIGCRTVDVIGLVGGIDVWVDDEGLYTQEPNPTLTAMIRVIRPFQTHLSGPGLFLTTDGEGDTRGLTEEQTATVIRWWTRQAEIVTELEADGLTVVTSWNYSTMAHLSRLTDAADDDTERPPLDAEAHTSCEGHAVFLTVNGLGEDDTETVPLCTKPELHQSIYRGYRSPVAEPVELSEEEAEAQAEAKRAERRTLIANNKAWDTAETVRKDWITALLTRKKLPTDAAAFVAVTLTRHSYDVAGDNSGGAAVFLGHEGYAAREALAAMVETAPTKAGYVSLAVALSARENRTSRASWRNPNASDTAYLLQLEKWGHHLTDVERIAAGHPAPETAKEAPEAVTE